MSKVEPGNKVRSAELSRSIFYSMFSLILTVLFALVYNSLHMRDLLGDLLSGPYSYLVLFAPVIVGALTLYVATEVFSEKISSSLKTFVRVLVCAVLGWLIAVTFLYLLVQPFGAFDTLTSNTQPVLNSYLFVIFLANLWMAYVLANKARVLKKAG